MMNKNCANYTDFNEQHYQRKIVQAPGGQSHFSIGWSNEKTDYGSGRNSRSLGKQKESNSQEGNYNRAPTYGQQQQGGYAPQPGNYAPQQGTYAPQQGSYSPGQYAPQSQYQPQPEQAYQLKQQSPSQQYSYKQEGTYGPVGATKIPSSTNVYADQPEELDMMAKQYDKKKRNDNPVQQLPQQQSQKPPRPPSNPVNKQDDKACIKIKGAPQSQITFGNDAYNYWKDTNTNLEPRKAYQNEPQQQGSYLPQSRSLERTNQYQPQVKLEEFKPSVKVYNPPGGKSNFQFG